jgi:hypothetical protein
MTAPNLLEKHIQQACEDILLLDGWRIFRLEQNWSEKKCKRVGEAGAPDCMAVRYLEHYQQGLPKALSEILFIEWKRPKGIIRAAQNEWHRYERKLGAVTWIAGEEFDATYEGFKAHYEASGLCRRRLT